MDARPHPDDVDAIVAAWQRERPDLDVSPLQVLSRVARIGGGLERGRGVAVAARGRESWELACLSALRRAGTPYELSPGQLAEETRVTSGTMTSRIDRRHAKGLVRRSPSRRDRRGVIVTLTTQGREHVDGAMIGLLAHETDLLRGLNDADRAHLATLLRGLGAQLD